MNVRKAEECKTRANQAFASGAYAQAIQLFTQAIALNATAIYYSNRAAAYLKIGQYQEALRDTSAAVKLDAKYAKGLSRHVETLIKVGRGSEAVFYAKELVALESNNKNSALLDDAHRCQSLVEGGDDSLEGHLDGASTGLLGIWAEMIQMVSECKFSLVSTQKRSTSEELDDQFELERCTFVEYVSQARDKVDNLISETLGDMSFVRKSMPGYAVDNMLVIHHYLLLFYLREFCMCAEKLGLKPFPSQATDDKKDAPEPNYLEDFKRYLKAYTAKTNCRWLIYNACLQVYSQEPENAYQYIQMAARVDPDSGAKFLDFARNLREHISHKDRGTSFFKANQFTSAVEEFGVSLSNVFSARSFVDQQGAGALKPLNALLYLSARPLSAIVCSNIGMCYSKQRQDSEAIKYLTTSVCLDPRYCKAHIRLANVYNDHKMLIECVHQCGIALSLDEKAAAGCQSLVKNCQADATKYARRDYYKLLGVDKGISTDSEDYKKAYKKACMKFHPDRNRDPIKKRFAENKFRLIQEADGILTDPRKRQQYDAGGNPAAGGADAAGADAFSGMFPGGMSSFPGGVRFQFVSSGGSGGRGMGGIDISQIFQMFGGAGGFGFE